MSLSVRLAIGVLLSVVSVYLYPLPLFAAGDALVDAEAPVLRAVAANSPAVYSLFYYSYFVTPGLFFFIVTLVIEAVVRVWAAALLERRSRGKLPPWPAENPERPHLVLGEVHHQIDLAPAPHPKWLVMPEKGLYTGLAIFGAVGTGKTVACMKPFSRQLLGWQHKNKEKRAAMLLLEVKGDFCRDCQDVLRDLDRFEDYMELSLDPDGFRWNPLNVPWVDTYSLAYNLSGIVNQLFGSGKEPFWQQAYTNTIRWIVECFRSFPDPWFTFEDIYNAMVDPKVLDDLITTQEKQTFEKYTFQINIPASVYDADPASFDVVEVTVDDFEKSKNESDERQLSAMTFSPAEAEQDKAVKDTGGQRPVKRFEFNWIQNEESMSIIVGDVESAVMRWHLGKPDLDIVYEQLTLAEPTADELKLTNGICRWYRSEWLGLDEKLRSSIVVGMSVFLGIFVVPDVARIFCPPREKDMDEAERKLVMPPLLEVIESGKVLALNMPAGANPALARAVGVMLKQSWLATLLLRPKHMKADEEAARAEKRPKKFFRPAVFLCDEYQAFATCGESDPAGDEKAFALTRQSRCMPIVATQSISSLRSTLGDGEAWRSLLQTLRSKIFLSISDEFTQETASKLTGQVTRLKASFGLSENTGKASVSVLSGRVGGSQASAGLSKNYAQTREALFHPRDFLLQKICQCIAQIFDGNTVLDATRLYLKPDFLPRETPYWESLGKEDVV